MLLQIVFATIPLIIITLILKEKVINKRVINILFYEVIAYLLVLIYTIVYFRYINIGEFTILGIILGNLIAKALPEELLKFIIIKKSKPKNEIEIIENALLTSAIFMFFENYMYSKNGIIVGGYRIFTPIHLMAQIVMAHYMIKSYSEKENKKVKLKYSILSVGVPIILHTLYNSIVNVIEGMGFTYLPIFIIILGIIMYIITYKFVKKGIKQYNVNDNNEIENKSISKTRIFIIVIFMLFWILTYKL